MTRVLLHPHLLPRTGPHGGARVYLPPPWRWWRHRLRPCPDGNLFHLQYDDPTDIREASFLFDLLEQDEIHDPPTLHITEFSPEFTTFYGGYNRTLMTRPGTGEVDVVWYQQPGAHWHPLPGNTCRPGDYQVSVEDRREDHDDSDSCRLIVESDMAALVWQQVETGEAAELGRRIAAAFGVPPAILGESTQPSSHAAEALRGFNTQLADIYQASRNYEARTQERPAAVLMSREDAETLRRDSLRDRRLAELNMYHPGPPFDSILGLEVVVEAAVPPGRIIVMSRDMLRQAQVLGLDRLGSALRELGRSSRGLVQQQPMRFGNPQREPGSYALSSRGFYSTPDEIRAMESLLAPPKRNNVLPEQDLVDEIDRLVNEQVATGPVDDYHVDRYPKCGRCGHQWHGILCDHCDCLGELEDEV